MSNCCNGSGPRKTKEWGTTEKKNIPNGKIKLLIGLLVIVVIGFIIFR